MTPHPNAPTAAQTPSGVASLFWTGLCDTQEVATIMGTKGQIVFQRPAHTPTTLTLTSQVHALPKLLPSPIPPHHHPPRTLP